MTYELMTYELQFKWSISHAKETQGYNVCTLLVDGKKVARCNGGNYDMNGTSLGIWIANAFADKLRKLKNEFPGLTFHDPNYNPMKAIVPGTNQTVEEREALGETYVDLEAYQAFYRGSSKLPTKNHTIPQLDGGCGFNAMTRVLEAIGGKLEYLNKKGHYTLTIKE